MLFERHNLTATYHKQSPFGRRNSPTVWEKFTSLELPNLSSKQSNTLFCTHYNLLALEQLVVFVLSQWEFVVVLGMLYSPDVICWNRDRKLQVTSISQVAHTSISTFLCGTVLHSNHPWSDMVQIYTTDLLRILHYQKSRIQYFYKPIINICYNKSTKQEVESPDLLCTVYVSCYGCSKSSSFFFSEHFSWYLNKHRNVCTKPPSLLKTVVNNEA